MRFFIYICVLSIISAWRVIPNITKNEKRNACSVLMGNRHGNSVLGILRYRRTDNNNNMDYVEI
jgi:hypothetical protein